MTRQASRPVAFVAMLMMVFAVVTGAHSDDSKLPVRFSGQTVYLHEDIEGFHRITIAGQLGGKGTLILNPNTCSVNEFGDTTVCTKVAEKSVRITIQDTNRPDPANLDRRLYALKGSGLSDPLYLLISPVADHPARLIYNNRGPHAPRPITLEPLVYSTEKATEAETNSQGTVEFCAANYTAQQVPGFVIVFATGVHPTAGYETFFKQLSITVYPPEFRLIHIRPTGIIAQVITPFHLCTMFPANGKVTRVIVHDANGRTEVPVEQVPDIK